MGLKKPRTWKGRLVRVLLVVAGLYLLVFVGLLLNEDRLVFRPDKQTERWISPPKSLALLQDVDLMADGVRIHAWWSPPEGWKKDLGAALFCHGNAGNLSVWGQVLASWNSHRDEAILIFDYPGYGKSEGQPSEAGCYAAAEAAYSWLVEKQKVEPDRIVLVGQSLGAAVSARLAAERGHRAQVLLSPFTSMPDMAALRFPIFPVRLVVHNRFDNLERLGYCHQPVFIAYGTADQVVPPQQAERVFAAANQPKKLYRLEGLGHVINPDAGFFRALHDFLEKAEAQSER